MAVSNWNTFGDTCPLQAADIVTGYGVCWLSLHGEEYVGAVLASDNNIDWLLWMAYKIIP